MMSVDMLGKVSSKKEYHDSLYRQITEIASRTGIGIRLGLLDAEDIAVLEEEAPTTEKFYFSVNSSDEEYDATDLWNEAYILARDILRRSIGKKAMEIANTVENVEWPDTYIPEMRNCRLGGFLYALAELHNYESIAVTLLDGGVESVFRGTAPECIEQILRMLLLPWDSSPNILYVWDGPAEDKVRSIPSQLL